MPVIAQPILSIDKHSVRPPDGLDVWLVSIFQPNGECNADGDWWLATLRFERRRVVIVKCDCGRPADLGNLDVKVPMSKGRQRPLQRLRELLDC